MRIAFDVGHHGDLFVNVDGQQHDFGYNSILTIPSFIWLAFWQQRRGNLFRDTRYPEEEREELSSESKETLQNVVEFSRMLPLDLRVFNNESEIQNLSSFTSGNHSIRYRICLQAEGNLLYSSQARETSEKVPLFTLEIKDYFSFTREYISFIQESENFGKYRWEVPGVVSRLGNLIF